MVHPREGRLKRHVTRKLLPKCMISGRTAGATVAADVITQANFGLRELAQPSQHDPCNLDPASNLAVAKRRGGCAVEGRMGTGLSRRRVGAMLGGVVAGQGGALPAVAKKRSAHQISDNPLTARPAVQSPI